MADTDIDTDTFAGVEKTVSIDSLLPPARGDKDAPDWSKLIPKPESFEAIRAGSEDVLRRKTEKTDAIFGEMEGRVERDRRKAETALDASWHSAQQLKPWDAEQKQKEIMTNPIEAFGSFASVFGILASAFTKAPLENALNSSAAAMNAIKARDEKQYERAYTAFKDNNELVTKRFEMQHKVYNDALHLMTTDVSVGKAKAELAAIRFGDEKALMLLQNGMIPEYIDYVNKTVAAAKGMSEATAKIDDTTFRRTARNDMLEKLKEKGLEKDPIARMEVFNFTEGLHQPWQQQLVMKYIARNPGASEDDVAKYAAKIRDAELGGRKSITMAGSDAAWVNERTIELMKSEDEGGAGLSRTDAYARARKEAADNARATARDTKASDERKWILNKTAELRDKDPSLTETAAEAQARVLLADSKKGTPRETLSSTENKWLLNRKAQIMEMEGLDDTAAEGQARRELTDSKRAVTTPRRDAEWVEKRSKEIHNENPDMSILDAYRTARLEATATFQSSPISGNRRVDEQKHIDQFDHGLKLVDNITGTLDKYTGAVGLPGRATRLAERLGNFGGSNKTDRVQVMRDIEQLRLIGPRLVLDQSTGRPLSAEMSKIEAVIAGLNAGDTTANTLRAMQEIKQTLIETRARAIQRLGGTWSPNPLPGGGTARPGVPLKKDWLDDFPKVGSP